MGRRPKVSVNMAISLDGKISTRSYTPARFTSAKDSQRLLELRSKADALLVGRGTLEADSMRMVVPKELLQAKPGPLRCVVSSKGEWETQHPIFHSEGPLVVLYSYGEGKKVSGAESVVVSDLLGLFADLSLRGVEHVHCEGGGELLRSLLEEDVVDEIFLTWASGVVFGGERAPSLVGKTGYFLTMSRHFELRSMKSSDEGECFLHYARKAI